MKNAIIVGVAVLVTALPFLFRQDHAQSNWRPGDPVLVAISPHNEAIRYEFAEAFSRWHERVHGRPVKVDWRTIGGTTEISRYLNSEYVAAFRTWWKAQGNAWPDGASTAVIDHRFKNEGADPEILRLRAAFRETNNAEDFGCGIDLFFGGGEYDHSRLYRQGLSVPAWPEGLPEDVRLIPERRSGETWRGTGFVGTALSTFGIVYNVDLVNALGAQAPRTWDDLADPIFARQLGVADPTKSGSIAKAFEMLIHQKVYQNVRASGFSDEQIEAYEKAIRGGDTASVPDGYAQAIDVGWRDGLHLMQRIGANARYFTDSASKVPVDVGSGNAAVGLAIDFYGRYQAECSKGPNGEDRMFYVTPVGGSSVSCDPVSLLRGAPNPELAVMFMEFVLSEEGQALWNYRPGLDIPGSPRKFALRRLPIRPEFYPGHPAHEAHLPHCTDDLSAPDINPYHLADTFVYRYRWTGQHFNFHRNLIRAMCLDSGDELRAAWYAILQNGGPEANPVAMVLLERLPDQLTWESALGPQYSADKELETMRRWTRFFRESYEEARRVAETGRS